jgi:hypothetical protein
MISSNFKKIFDFITGIRQNQDYWAMNAQEKNKVKLLRNFKRGMYKMINEFLGKWPIIQPPHTKDLMADGNGIFKLVKQTLERPIEFNDNSIATKLGMPRVNMDVATNKVFPHNIDEAWLYEQPQSTEPIQIERVNLPKATTPL